MSTTKVPILAVPRSLTEAHVDFNVIASGFGWRVGDGTEPDTVAVAVLCELGVCRR
jgi:hypothetical protein